MDKVKNLVNKFINIVISEREKVFAFVISVGLTLVFFFDINYFQNRISLLVFLIAGIVIMVIVMGLLFIAGFTVMRTLFLVSAEISLLIFLAQAYCGAVKENAANDNSLELLMTVGIAYIGYEFFRRLQEALNSRLESIPEKLVPWEKIIVITLFILFTVTFVWSLYRVVNPVVTDLCIYKR